MLNLSGARVALVCPSGPPQLQPTLEGIALLKSWGLQAEPGPILASYLDASAHRQLDFLAASDSQRWEELQWAFSGAFDACWVVRGGYGIGRLFPSLVSLSPQNLPVLGFSDVTALLLALQQSGWTQLFHAPNVQSLGGLEARALNAVHSLTNNSTEIAPLEGERWRPGLAQGPLWGGNLCVLASLCGARELRPPKSGVLFLEDINEAPYRLDRMFNQLWLSGLLDGLEGLVLGSWTGCGDYRPVLQHWVERLNVPTLAEVPAGHCPQNYPLQLGRAVALEDQRLIWL